MSGGDDLGAGAVPDASAPRVTGEIDAAYIRKHSETVLTE